MSHPKNRVETVGDIRVEVSAFKNSYYFYKSIGVDVEVRKTKKKRRWWCLGLCKTRENFNASRILIHNTYYASIDNRPITVVAASHAGECLDKADCKLKHWAVGVGAKIRFPGGGATPSVPDDLLPLDGVQGQVTVELPEKTLTFSVATGAHPG